MKPLKINSEYLALVPRPSKEEYEALERDIIAKQGALERARGNSIIPCDGLTLCFLTSK